MGAQVLLRLQVPDALTLKPSTRPSDEEKLF